MTPGTDERAADRPDKLDTFKGTFKRVPASSRCSPVSPQQASLRSAEHALDDCCLPGASQGFSDREGRTVILRGVNLTAKVPLNSPSHDASHHLDLPSHPSTAGQITFVNTPLDLSDPTEEWRVHLARLKGWGFNAVRLAVVWEAIEHAGPGKYDEAYLDYVVRLLRVLKDAGLRVFIDPHQDCWSRATGGSGAPFWTLNACGLDPHQFQQTQSALVHGLWNGRDGRTPAEPWPAMVWQTNAFKLACATAFTMFWAGRDFAPKALIDGVNIQTYLQRHYVDAFGALAKRVADAGDLNDTVVMGWDSMNEPLQGYLGMDNLSSLSDKQSLKLGPTPTPLEGFKLGVGQKVKIVNYRFGKLGAHKDGHAVVDPEGMTCWLSPDQEPAGVSPWGWKRDASWRLGECLWEQHGVWNSKTGELVRPDYFAKRPDGKDDVGFDFLRDYWVEAWQKFNARIREHQPEAIAFINPPVFEEPPRLDEVDQGGRCCLTPHYYDGLTLLNKRLHTFNGDAVGLLRHNIRPTEVPKLGSSSIRKSIRQQLHTLTIGDTHPDRGLSSDGLRSYPALIGETGVPFDFRPKDTFFRLVAQGDNEDDYAAQEAALDQNLSGCEGEKAVGWMLWEYKVDNTHEKGDNWNGEDFSIFCRDDWLAIEGSPSRPPTMHDLLNVGCRGQRAYCRPYPAALVGIAQEVDFDIKTSICEMLIRQDLEEDPASGSEAESLIYCPFLHYALERHAVAEDGSTSKPPGHGFARRTLHFTPSCLSPHHSHEHAVHLTGRPESDPPLGILSWSDDAPRAQVDIKLTVNLMDGQPAAGEHLELQVEAVGQWLRLRWTGDGARERARVYELKIERWESRADKPKKVHSLKHPFGKVMPVSAA